VFHDQGKPTTPSMSRDGSHDNETSSMTTPGSVTTPGSAVTNVSIMTPDSKTGSLDRSQADKQEAGSSKHNSLDKTAAKSSNGKPDKEGDKQAAKSSNGKEGKEGDKPAAKSSKEKEGKEQEKAADKSSTKHNSLDKNVVEKRVNESAGSKHSSLDKKMDSSVMSKSSDFSDFDSVMSQSVTSIGSDIVTPMKRNGVKAKINKNSPKRDRKAESPSRTVMEKEIRSDSPSRFRKNKDSPERGASASGSGGGGGGGGGGNRLSGVNTAAASNNFFYLIDPTVNKGKSNGDAKDEKKDDDKPKGRRDMPFLHNLCVFYGLGA